MLLLEGRGRRRSGERRPENLLHDSRSEEDDGELVGARVDRAEVGGWPRRLLARRGSGLRRGWRWRWVVGRADDGGDGRVLPPSCVDSCLERGEAQATKRVWTEAKEKNDRISMSLGGGKTHVICPAPRFSDPRNCKRVAPHFVHKNWSASQIQLPGVQVFGSSSRVELKKLEARRLPNTPLLLTEE